MRSHLLQTDICWHDRQKNFDRVRALLSPVNVASGDLILLPEMFDKGFSMDTQETADNAVKALKDRNACLLANHGMIVVGPNLKKAMWLAVEVETLARQYHGCLAIGEPPLLSKDEIERVRARMTGYGHAG